VKKFLPNAVKYPFWYLLKAPQRSISSGTLWRDIRGLFIYFFRQFRKKENYTISICIGIANRTQMLLHHVLPSLLAIEKNENIELSIYDMGSEDYILLEEEIRKNWKGKLIFTHVEEKFTRSKAFNQAVNQSTGDVIFICDADMSFPSDLVSQIQQLVRKNIVWYPIYYANGPDDKHKTGKWLWWSAKGMLACLKSDFEKVGKLNETYTNWGFEDEDLWKRFHQNKFVVIRQKLKGLIHHYHLPAKGAKGYFGEEN